MRIKEHLLFIIPISIISTLILSFAVLFIIAICRPDTTQLAKDEFSKYYDGKNDVVLNIEDNLFFEEYTLMHEDIQIDFRDNSYIFYERSICFISFSKKAKATVMNVHSCDLDGGNLQIIYSKILDTKSKVVINTQGDSYYIQYEKDDVVYIDKYTISTNVYENIDSGKDCSLSDYSAKSEISKYDIEVVENLSPQEHGKFIITNSETNEIRIIDDAFLKNTVYIESMEMYNYSPKRYDISNGHILLTYSIGAGDGWNFPHLIFEYDFDTDTLVYKMLVFPYDSVPIEIIYIN